MGSLVKRRVLDQKGHEMRIALHGSSFVASGFDHNPPGAWEECVTTLSSHFAPLTTFEPRFERLIDQVRELGFSRMDVWQPAELNWQWAEAGHVAAAVRVLRSRGVTPTSLAGEFGATRAEFTAACSLAAGIGAPLLSGTTALYHSDREFVIETLKRHHLRLAIENEVELTPAVMLAEIGDGVDGMIGTALDTGWYATHGYDPAQAVRDLCGHIFHVHLKDVLPGEEHINCGYGRGCVPVEECVKALITTGYRGVISVENHTLDHDPAEELVRARKLLENLLS